MKFSIGNWVSYPSHGTALVTNITERTFGGKTQTFYQLFVEANGATLLLDVNLADQAGLRAVLSPDEMHEALQVLSSEPDIQTGAWYRRFRELADKMRSNSVKDLAEVARDVHAMKGRHELSYSEKKMLDKAVFMLTTETAASSGISQDAAEALVLSYLP